MNFKRGEKEKGEQGSGPVLLVNALRLAPETRRPYILHSIRSYATNPPPPQPPTNNDSKTIPQIKPAQSLQYTGRPDPSTEPQPRQDLLDPSAKDSDDPIPRPLSRPIGLPYAPQAGTNTGTDARSWKQRRDDFVDYDKHIERRKNLAAKLYRPYFRDFSAMRHFKGKTFLSNERLFRGEHALFFPNLRGRTLKSEGEKEDTTTVLKGRVSVVAVFSSGWAENQVRTFIGKKENAALHEVLGKEKDVAQLVEINSEPNPLKWWILRAFAYRLRAMIEKADWGRYFVVRRGFEEDIREAIGALNSKVGYVYLLDQECRIRWAGSAKAMDDEKESLIKGLQRLVKEARTAPKEKKVEKTVEKLVEKAASVVEAETL
ncbi:ATP10 protein-domain-containing protein [Delphinella strobiligena]|nr:ATP10 protein-domain-containing protein [Delphinella strobiligena]